MEARSPEVPVRVVFGGLQHISWITSVYLLARPGSRHLREARRLYEPKRILAVVAQLEQECLVERSGGVM